MVALLAGVIAATLSFFALHSAFAGMLGYTAALMVLNQAVPPLALYGVGGFLRHMPGRAWLSDPLVALVLFSGVSIAVSVPQILSHGLAEALFTLPIGALELMSGLLIWAQVFPRTRHLRSDLALAGYLTLANIPMTVVAVIWMTAPGLLYAPYVDVVCLWNVTPLQDQHDAGFVMLLAAFPLQVAAFWLLVEGALSA